MSIKGEMAEPAAPATVNDHAPAATQAVSSLGTPVGQVAVSIGARFLHLFSEQLYTSPNKAFEELVSNSWDAGASLVHIGIPDDLTGDTASLWVLDNGVSMDIKGLELLWAVADDHKAQPDWPRPAGREQIGMFGIGKLATYVLADEITYVCRDADGVIRALTVDYREIQRRGEDRLHVSEVPFTVRELDETDLTDLLDGVDPKLRELIGDTGVVAPEPLALEATDADQRSDADAAVQGSETPYDGDVVASASDDADRAASEFHDEAGEQPETGATWTLAILTSLKERGRAVSKPTVKRVLRSALPLGDTIQLVMDGDLLESAKVDMKRLKTFVLGRDFAPDRIERESDQREIDVETIMRDGEPALRIEGLSEPVSGEIQIYERSIASGRSAERARSNGFFVNVRGRVINLHDERFGLPALSHGVWAKLRIVVRADALNDSLSVSRETVEDTDAVDALRGLLRAAFNKARTYYEDHAQWPSLNDILTDKWGTVPLTPLLNAVNRAVEGDETAGMLVDTSQVDDIEEAHRQLEDAIRDNPAGTLREVRAQPGNQDGPLAVYELGTRRVLINSQHPYYVEQIKGRHEPQEVLHTAALVALLSDAYLLELGVTDPQLSEARRYRDNVERLIARTHRRSAPLLAHMLLQSTGDEKALETLIAECLAFLGFRIRHQAQKGKPEGIATADLAPGRDGQDRRYRLVYEAKSTNNAERKVSTKDVNVSGQDRHRRKAAADTDDSTEVEHALVVAPNFRSGALEDECQHLGVCPMRARDLARLLMGVAATGPLDLVAFRDVLDESDPDEVARKIDALIAGARESVGVTMRELVDVLLEFDNVDQISVGVLADRMRSRRTDKRPRVPEVRALLRGLEMLVPSVVQMIGDDGLVLGTTPERLAEAVRVQAAGLPDEHRFELDQIPPLETAS